MRNDLNEFRINYVFPLGIEYREWSFERYVSITRTRCMSLKILKFHVYGSSRVSTSMI